jgi:hypothetical protein
MNYEISICLDGKDQLRDAGDEKGIENPGDKREQKKEYNCWFNLLSDYRLDWLIGHI